MLVLLLLLWLMFDTVGVAVVVDFVPVVGCGCRCDRVCGSGHVYAVWGSGGGGGCRGVVVVVRCWSCRTFGCFAAVGCCCFWLLFVGALVSCCCVRAQSPERSGIPPEQSETFVNENRAKVNSCVCVCVHSGSGQSLY